MLKERAEIRLLRKEDIDESLRLSCFAFQYDIPESDWAERRSSVKPEQQLGAFVDGRLASKIGILPLVAYIHGQRYAMGGIAGVATWPEYRRHGLVAALLMRSLEMMRDAGQSVSFLHPFSFAFYRKYGWETYVDRKKMTIATDQLPKIAAEDVRVRIERVGTDSPAVREVYEQYASRYNGMLSRSEEWWNDRVFRNRKGQMAVSFDAEGRACGYVHYQVKNRELTVHEFVAVSRDARRGLWRHIAMHDSMIERVVLTAPADDPLAMELDNPRIKQEIEPYFMARIVDVEAFCGQYRFAAAGDADDFAIRIRDEQAPWNDGVFRLHVEPDGSAAAVRDQSGTAADLECSIQTLSMLMMGYSSAEQLHDLDRLTGSPEAIRQLSARMTRRTPYLSDFF